MQNNKFLITGGKGFIGKHLETFLKNKNIEVIAPSSKEFDVTQKQDWKTFLLENITCVIHLAGRTFVPDSWEKPDEFISMNFQGTVNAVEFCRIKNIPMVFISAYIYGKPKKLPISEGDEVNPNNPYAESKYISEQVCEFYARNFNLNIAALRLFNVYGPNQKENFLVPHIINQVKNSDKEIIEILDLTPKRDYVYIEDVCDAIYKVAEKNSGYNVYNIGSGESYSVKEVIDIIQELSETNKEVVSKQQVRPNEMNDVVADIAKIFDDIGWKPMTEFRDGLKRCIEQE